MRNQFCYVDWNFVGFLWTVVVLLYGTESSIMSAYLYSSSARLTKTLGTSSSSK